MVFIKKMICEGFKSFRRKTIVQFDKGFTAIVGANGSGKSNIIDAFVFVLGELSAKTLRANNIKDLISNGGNGLSQAETASVEIFFDNHDKVIPIEAEEVAILRKIDREGNGIYKLNGKKSTRKDIMELLDLAGILPNTSNMIMQGELFRLITMNAIERRQLIENIAGIASYNEKRMSADEELTKVQSNLGQISLLLNEVYTQMQQLEKEKNDALKYLEVVQQEKIHHNALFTVRIQSFKEKIEEMNADRVLADREIVRIQELEQKSKQQIDEIQKKIDTLNQKIKATEDAELSKLSSNLNNVKDIVTELRSSLKYTKNYENTQIDLGILKNEFQSLDGKEIQLNQAIAQAKEKKDILNQTIKTKSDEIAQLETHLNEIDAQYLKIKEQSKQLLEKINGIKDQKNAKETEIKVLENEIQANQSQRKKIEQKMYQNHTDLGHLKSELRNFQAQQAQIIENNGGEDLSKENIEKLIKAHEQRITELQQQQKRLSIESKEKHAALVELQSKVKIYKQMNSGNAAVEAILKLKKSDEIPGIFGTIANCGSADPKYATALEMAAGGKFNWVVVDHGFTAEKCIQFLKQNKIGRATFIPLSAVQVASTDYRVPDSPQIHGKAVDLITFDPFVKKAFDFVFGRCVIVDDIQTANELKLSVKRVTLDGDVVESTNIMTGGQRMRPTGAGFKSVESNETTRLEEDYAKIQETLENNDTEIKSIQVKISELYKKKITGDKESQKIAEKVMLTQSKMDRITSEIKTQDQELSELLNTINQLSTKKQQHTEESTKITSELSISLENAKQFQSQLESSEENTIKKQIRSVENEIKKFNKESMNVEMELTKATTSLTESVINRRLELTEKISQKDTSLIQMKGTIEQTGLTLIEKEQLLQELEKKLAEKSAALAQLLDEKKQLVLEISQLKTNLGQLGNDVHPLQMKINTIQLKTGEIETKIG